MKTSQILREAATKLAANESEFRVPGIFWFIHSVIMLDDEYIRKEIKQELDFIEGEIVKEAGDYYKQNNLSYEKYQFYRWSLQFLYLNFLAEVLESEGD